MKNQELVRLSSDAYRAYNLAKMRLKPGKKIIQKEFMDNFFIEVDHLLDMNDTGKIVHERLKTVIEKDATIIKILSDFYELYITSQMTLFILRVFKNKKSNFRKLNRKYDNKNNLIKDLISYSEKILKEQYDNIEDVYVKGKPISPAPELDIELFKKNYQFINGKFKFFIMKERKDFHNTFLKKTGTYNITINQLDRIDYSIRDIVETVSKNIKYILVYLVQMYDINLAYVFNLNSQFSINIK